MGKRIIAQGKAPISSESVEGNEIVEKDMITFVSVYIGIKIRST